MLAFLVLGDLSPFADIEPGKAQAMIDDAEAYAVLAAPCIASDDFQADAGRVAAARAVLRGAVLRWNEAGTGAAVQQTAGPFNQTIDNRQQRRAMFLPSEISALRDLCASGDSTAFSIDTVGSGTSMHSEICTLNFGGAYCSCGAVLTGLFPLYERGQW